MTTNLIRVQYKVYDTREAALTAGFPDAEFGVWGTSPLFPKQRSEGWIALDYEENCPSCGQRTYPGLPECTCP